MEKAIEELIELAKDWRDFHEKFSIENARIYNSVWCYREIGGNRRAVYFTEVEVSFYSTTKISFLSPTYINVAKINSIVERYRKQLKQLIVDSEKITTERKYKEKAAKIEALNREVKRLEI